MTKRNNKTKFALIEKINYLAKYRGKPGTFEAGFVKFSAHKENTIYLVLPDNHLFEFTDDEAMAAINVLSSALWQRNVPMSREKRKKLKWHKKEVEYEA